MSKVSALLYVSMTVACFCCCTNAAYAGDEAAQAASPTEWLKTYRPQAAPEDTGGEKYKLKTSISALDMEGTELDKDKDKPRFISPDMVRDINKGEKLMRFRMKVDPTAERKPEDTGFSFMKKDEVDKLSGNGLHKDE